MDPHFFFLVSEALCRRSIRWTGDKFQDIDRYIIDALVVVLGEVSAYCGLLKFRTSYTVEVTFESFFDGILGLTHI